MTLLETFALLGLAAWIVLTLDRTRSWPGRLRLELPSDPSAEDERPGDIVVLIPARNESETIGATLPSLLRQLGDGGEVVVIDDGSSDRTIEIAQDCSPAPEAGCVLTVLSAPPCRESENGKIAALHHGLDQVRVERRRSERPLPRWFLLTDADVFHRSRSVRDLVAVASGPVGEPEFDLVSVMARLHAESCWERLLIPPFVFFFHLLYPFRRVRDPRSRIAAAAGGCVLVRTETLLEIGGLESIRDEIIDDVALAKQVKRRGGRVLLTLDEGIRSIRRYDRLGDLWEMIARAAFAQLRFSPLLLVLTLAALAILVVAPPVILVLALSHLWLASSPQPVSMSRCAIWSASSWILQFRLLLPWVRHHRVGMLWAGTLPAAGLLYGLMTAASASTYWRGRGSSWKGRRVRLDVDRQSGEVDRDQGSRTEI